RIAHRRRDGALVEVSVDALAPGDVVVVRPGEVVPVDGRVEEGEAVLDEAALTGESLPVTRRAGEPVRSGTLCAGGAFALRAERAGVIVKDGGAIERLAQARSVLIDKTGTLTLGEPAVERVLALDGYDPDELRRLAASADQLSAHGLAEGLVHDAERRGLRL